MGHFKDKVVLISGSSRGVGFALAKSMVEDGAKVVITARTEKRLLDSKKKLEDIGGEVEAIVGDVGKWEDCQKMVNAAVDGFGGLDILVNNAGISMRGHFDELTSEVCEQVISTNLTGCVLLSKAAIPHILERKGQIVFISSIAGLFGLPGASIYCSTKKALTGFAESLRLELIPKGVNIGVVYLGFTEHDPEKRIVAADGSLVPPDRPAHHTQAHAAELIAGMLLKRKKQLIMTPIGTLGWMIYRLSPAIIEKAVLFAQSSKIGIFKKFS
jgi:NAD(P)-dependent dehydrogenase (short-subunit alcohol dehydrogenase family)